MAKKQSEAFYIEQYLRSEGEKSSQHYLYDFLKQVFPGKLIIETAAKGADAYIEGKLIVERKVANKRCNSEV